MVVLINTTGKGSYIGENSVTGSSATQTYEPKDRALSDCWRFDLESTEWTELKLKINETVQTPKQEIQQRLGPNRRHSLGSPADQSIRGDYQKYMRMWHTAFYNKFNGKMMICGGTNSQNSFYRNLPPVFLLKGMTSSSIT